jgi:hypothetical protein
VLLVAGCHGAADVAQATAVILVAGRHAQAAPPTDEKARQKGGSLADHTGLLRRVGRELTKITLIMLVG